MTSGVLCAVLGYGNVNIRCFTSGFTCIFFKFDARYRGARDLLLYFATLAPTEVCCFVSS